MKNKFDFIVNEKFIESNDVALLNQCFDKAFGGDMYASVHSNVVQLTEKDVLLEPLFDELGEKLVSYFHGHMGVSDLKFNKLWLVSSDAKDTDRSALPYIPHFDKHRCLKAMVYLHDVTADHGPIHFGKLAEYVDIEQRRKKLPINYKDLGLNTICKEDLDGEMIPMVGRSGDVIFFDTNSAHQAGIITEGFQRRVLRFDFEHADFNPKVSFLKRSLSRLVNAI